MKKLPLLLFISLAFLDAAFAQTVYPKHWWVGMEEPMLQLIVHHEKIAHEKLSIEPYAGVKLLEQRKLENPNYLIINLSIAKITKPGKLVFRIDSPKGQPSKTINYELKQEVKKMERAVFEVLMPAI